MNSDKVRGLRTFLNSNDIILLIEKRSSLQNYIKGVQLPKQNQKEASKFIFMKINSNKEANRAVSHAIEMWGGLEEV